MLARRDLVRKDFRTLSSIGLSGRWCHGFAGLPFILGSAYVDPLTYNNHGGSL